MIMDKEQRTHALFFITTFAIFLSYWICLFLIKQATRLISSCVPQSTENETQTSINLDVIGLKSEANSGVDQLNQSQNQMEIDVGETEKENGLKSKITMSTQQQLSPLSIPPRTQQLSSVSKHETSYQSRTADRQCSPKQLTPQETQQNKLQNAGNNESSILKQIVKEQFGQNNEIPLESTNINDHNMKIQNKQDYEVQKQETGKQQVELLQIENRNYPGQGTESVLCTGILVNEEKVNELTAINEELKKNLQAKHLHCQALREQNDSIKRELALLQHNQLLLENQKQVDTLRLAEEQETKQKQIENWKSMNQKLTLQLMQSSLKLEVKSKEKANLETKLNSKQEEIEYLYESVKQLNIIIENQQQEILNLQQQAGERAQNILQLQTQLNQSQSINEHAHPHSQNEHKNQNKQQTNSLEISTENENLKNEIMFAQTQIRLFEETEVRHEQQIQNLQAQVNKLTLSKDQEILELKEKVSRMQAVASDYEVLHRRYLELRAQLQKQKANLNSPTRIKTESSNFSQIIDSKTSYFKDSPSDNKSQASFQKSQTSFASYSTNQHQLLFNSQLVSQGERQFILQNVSSIFEGTVKCERIYSSKTNRNKNPHELIDNIRCILAIIKLSSGKVISAYTHESFSIIKPQSTKGNIALIMDVSNRKVFSNKTGLNSIVYNPSGLIWGLNEVMLKFQEPDIMYSSFGKSSSIFWDGKYSLEQFLGTDKQWAKIDLYQLYRISKV